MSTKIGEKIHLQDEGVVVQEIHDYSPVLRKAEVMRQQGMTDFGESKLVGLLPMKLMAEWAKEAGVMLSDPAMKEIVKRKMLSGEFDKFRVYKGTY